MSDASLNILYLSDNNYAAFAGVSVTSLFINNKHIPEITVFLIDDGISQENKQKFIDTAEAYSRKIMFLDLSAGVKKLTELGAPKYRNSYTTYLKLFTFNLLPNNVKRIFFIDSDSVVVGDLSELLNLDMKGQIIGAVRDGLCHSYKMALGYPETDSWFNMGIMLVNVEAWKNSDAEERVIKQLKKRSAYVAVDQDILNITQHNDIFTLHPKYNATPHHYVYNAKDFERYMPQKGFYPPEVLEEGQKKAVIRHFERFIGESPWHLNSVHPYTELFDQYLSVSKWKDYQKKPANKNTVLKIEKVLYDVLPKKLFLRIWALSFRKYLKKMNDKFKNGYKIENIN